MHTRALLLPALLLNLTALLGCGDKDSGTTPDPVTGDDDTDTTGGGDDTDTTGGGDDTGEPPAQRAAGALTGSVYGFIDGQTIYFRDATVTFTSTSADAEPVKTTTSEWGMFRLDGAPQGEGVLCVAAEGMSSPTCTETLLLGEAAQHVGTIEVKLAPPVAWGRVAFPDGTPCAYSFPTFGVQVSASVSASDGRTVQTNVSGEFILPNYSGELTARCEGNEVTGTASGETSTTLTLKPYLKGRGPIQLTGRSSYSALMRPPAGAVLGASLQAEVEAGATLSIQWQADGLEATGSEVTWTLPAADTNSAPRLWAHLSDGMGYHELISAHVVVDAPLVYAGQLLDADGKPIVGAVVRVNGEETTSDADGLYDLEVTAPADLYRLEITHPDFTPCNLIQHDSWRGSLFDPQDADGVSCLRRLSTTTFTASRGTTLKTGSFSIPISGGVMVDAAGKAVSGDVEAAWYEVPPGEPLAAEPILTDKEDIPSFAETLGGLYLVFRNPADPTQRYSVAKGGTVSHTRDSSVKDSDKVVLAGLDADTGRLTTISTAIEHGSSAWGYSMPLSSDFFVVAQPVSDVGCIRVSVPRTRFAGDLFLSVSVPATQTTQHQFFWRSVQSNIVGIGGLPKNQTTTLNLYHQLPGSYTLQHVETAEVRVTGKVRSMASFDAYPFTVVEEACAEVALPSQGPPGTFLTRHLVTDVTHDGHKLLKPDDVANQYYYVVDPLDEKTTLSDWLDSLAWSKASPHDTTGDEATAIYGNAGDLGFGREMHLQILDDPDGDGNPSEPPVVAMYTVNYEDVHHAAIGSGVAATVAMEYSPHPLTGGSYYTKFFVFDASGNRIPSIALDDGGQKAVPDLCVNCHGGQPASEGSFYTVDPATNTVLTMNLYPDEGRLGDAARFIPFAVETFAYSPLFPRAAQEEDFRILNEALLLTNLTDDARALVHGWYDSEASYASDTLGSSGTTQDTTWYPVGLNGVGGAGGDWSGQEDLYHKVYQPYCRSCHMSFDYTDFVESALFLAYSGTIRSYVCTAPTMMPQAQVTQQNLFADDAALQELVSAMRAHDPSGWTTKTCPQ